MPKQKPASEFGYAVEPVLQGGWTWSIQPLNGYWPDWLAGGLPKRRECWTKGGAERAAHRWLRKIDRYIKLNGLEDENA